MIDDALGDEVKVTVIAAGFEGGQPPRQPAWCQPRCRPAYAPGTLRSDSPDPEPVGVTSNNNYGLNHVSPVEAPPPARSRHPSRSLLPASRYRAGPPTKMI